MEEFGGRSEEAVRGGGGVGGMVSKVWEGVYDILKIIYINCIFFDLDVFRLYSETAVIYFIVEFYRI